MVPEDDHVVLDGGEVRERGQVVVEVDAVIPDEKVVADLGPAFQGLHELLSGRILGQGGLPAAVDVAQHDGHVLPGDRLLRRLHGEQVGQGRYLLVREPVRHGVDETEDGAGRTALLVQDPLALRASAVGVRSVVLADTDHLPVRIGLEQAVQALAHDLQHLRVAHAPLAGAAGIAFPVIIGVILRMLFPVAGSG